jgi:protoheme IX farnesyltransferase
MQGKTWLRRFSKLVCFSTIALIFIGGMVTSTNSGLSVPDWPTTYGQNMFTYPVSQWQGGIFYEHGHRLVASAVGFLTLVMAIWLPVVDKRDWVRFLAFAALSAVILQGLLGGLTVLMKLPPAVSVFHGVLAQTFFILTVFLAYSQSRERQQRTASESPAAFGTVARAATWVVGVIYAQLILGAVMRHTHAGLAIPDFPTTGGAWLPVYTADLVDRANAMRSEMGYLAADRLQVIAHLAHRIGALAVVAAVVVLNIVARGPAYRRLRASIITLDLLLVAQVGLAAFTIWTQRSPVITSLHVAVGASLLGWSTLLALRAAPVRAERAGAQDTGGEGQGMPRALPSAEAMSLSEPGRSTPRGPAAAWREMLKLRIVSMVLVTTTIGFFLAGQGLHGRWLLLALTLIGTGLAAAGSAVLNNYLERDIDAKMERTRKRPLPAGEIEPAAALACGVILVLSGVAIQVAAVNLLAGFLTLLTAFLYVLVYTPLKRLTWLNTPVGAIPGALPPMIGWAAAADSLGTGAWILFAILFAWQHPHFYAIAWMFRDDYARGGLKMLSCVDATGRRLFRQALLFSLLLMALTVALHLMGFAGGVFLFGSVVAGAGLLVACMRMCETHSLRDARTTLLASVVYLPVLLCLLVVDAGFTGP